MQITNKPVQLWLHDLQDLAYDIDDILDDLATEALHRELNAKDNTSQVRKLIPTCCTSFSPRNLNYGDKMGSKLEDITSRLQDLIDKKSILGLRENIRSLTDRRGESLQTTSLVDELSIVGRETDKDALLKLVLSTETSNKNLSIISVVGMGGLGKTTLAQLVYNSKEVKDKFDIKAWVCVSEDFDVLRITNTIYGQVADEDKQDLKDLNKIQVALKQKLSEKRFLIVLDDVWNEDFQKWELLQQPFQGRARGSRIITTTRNMSVASTIRCDHEYHLNVLTDEQSLSLFSMYATGTKHFNANPTLRLLGEDISKKCKGLPLALIMLGRVLRDKTSDEDWRVLLDSKIWDLQEKENVVLPALRISYHHLPIHLRKLFAYCSLFVKDYLFDSDELVLLWMAEGFLKHSDDKLTFGRKCFEELLSRSFFQQSASKESQYLMHDLTHDLASFVAGEFFFRLDNKTNVHDNNEALKKLRHFSFACQKYEVYTRFKALHGAKRLRTFLPVSIAAGYPEFYMSNKVLIELLPHLQLLRILSLKDYHIEEVPKSIGGLKHLRYLNFSGTHIKSLPEQIAELYNLQTLLLSGCWSLTKLPNSFTKLINLRHLDITDTPELQSMPLGIGGLTNLQTLSKVVIGEGDGFRITELKGFSNLQGRLAMKGLDKVVNSVNAKEANLFEKKGLKDIEMEWGNVFDDSRKAKTEFEALKALRPHDKLKMLKIVYYGGIEFPSWVREPSFVGLKELELRGCNRCTSLPSLGHLPSLEKLLVEGMHEVKSIGREFLGPGGNGIVFPSLKTLVLSQMEGWEIWSTVGNDNGVVFPCLSELRIQGCPNLVEVSIHLVPSLRVLDVDGCLEVVLRSIVRMASSITNLTIRDIRGLSKLERGVIEFLRGVEYLCIWGCDELRYLWELEAEASKVLVNLSKLRVSFCPELVCFGEKEKEEEEEEVSCLTSLRELELRGCGRVEYCFSMKSMEEIDGREGECAGVFPNLETLDIIGCSGMKWLPTGHKKLPSTLKRLVVVGCKQLLLLEESGGESSNISLLLNNSNSSSLEHIGMGYYGNLKRWPELGSFLHLTSLSIFCCEGIESFPQEQQSQGQQGGGVGFFPLGLRYLEIRNCKNLKWFPHDEFPTLTSLVRMNIIDLPSLESGGFPNGVVWPPNLRQLRMGGLKKPMTKWCPQMKFPTSLVHLSLLNESCLVSFVEETQEEMVMEGTTTTTATPTRGFTLPSSLITLWIYRFENLESVSKGLQHLTSLEHLHICNCPKLRDLPDTLLPHLSSLWISNSPKLEEKCSPKNNRRDSFRPAISHIPCLQVVASNT